MPAAQTVRTVRRSSERHRVCGAGSEVSPRDLLQRLILEQLIGHDPLQPRVLTLQLLQPLRVVGLQAAVLEPPTMKRLLRHLELLRHEGDLLALPEQPVGLPQLPDDLLRRMPASRTSHRSDCPPCPTLGGKTLATTGPTSGGHATGVWMPRARSAWQRSR